MTLQYSDIESHKKTLKIEQDRLWALLEKADSMDSIIALEERLSDIRYELESYESQLRLYDNQIEYSKVTLNINEVKRYTEVVPESAGEQILKGLSDNGRRLAEGVKKLWNLCDHYQPVLDNSSSDRSSDRVPGVEAQENFQETEI